MSRKIIIMCVTLGALLLLSLIEQVTVKRITNDALAQTQAILSDIRAQSYDAAMQKTHALDQAWDEKAKVMETIVDHHAMDDVRYALSRLLAALETQDTSTAMVYASELEGGIEHVYERQMLSIENIL